MIVRQGSVSPPTQFYVDMDNQDWLGAVLLLISTVPLDSPLSGGSLSHLQMAERRINFPIDRKGQIEMDRDAYEIQDRRHGVDSTSSWVLHGLPWAYHHYVVVPCGVDDVE